MARYSTIVTTQGDGADVPAVPIAGASVLVLKSNGALETVTADGGGLLLQPLTTGSGGQLVFNVPDPGDVYTLQYRYGGRLIREDEEIIGNPPVFVGPPGPAFTPPSGQAVL